MAAHDGRALSKQLSQLKRRGCNLLVVNDASSVGTVCTRLLGDPCASRSHLFVPTTTTVPTVLDRRSSFGRNPNALGVIDATRTERTRAVEVGGTPGVDTDAEWYTAVDRLDDLRTLAGLVDDHLDRLSRESVEPGALRVCVESLGPFLEAVETRRLFAFLHVLTSRVRDHAGQGHVHLASGVDDETIDLFEPLFDVTVRVRADDRGRRQRWLIHETGHDTGWLPFDG